ncbi:hypothetical protein GOBAR_DD10550 [Gossypium barbadense]|nr:hypothetical protein GOBAR_DD10550 [Gossypium barbadense]
MDVKQYYLFSYFKDIILFCRAIEHPTFSALTRPLCDLYSLIPPLLVVTHKKLRVCRFLLVMSLRALMEVIKGKLLVFMVLKIGVKLVVLIPCLLIMD